MILSPEESTLPAAPSCELKGIFGCTGQKNQSSSQTSSPILPFDHNISDETSYQHPSPKKSSHEQSEPNNKKNSNRNINVIPSTSTTSTPLITNSQVDPSPMIHQTSPLQDLNLILSPELKQTLLITTATNTATIEQAISDSPTNLLQTKLSLLQANKTQCNPTNIDGSLQFRTRIDSISTENPPLPASECSQHNLIIEEKDVQIPISDENNVASVSNNLLASAPVPAGESEVLLKKRFVGLEDENEASCDDIFASYNQAGQDYAAIILPKINKLLRKAYEKQEKQKNSQNQLQFSAAEKQSIVLMNNNKSSNNSSMIPTKMQQPHGQEKSGRANSKPCHTSNSSSNSNNKINSQNSSTIQSSSSSSTTTSSTAMIPLYLYPPSPSLKQQNLLPSCRNVLQLSTFPRKKHSTPLQQIQFILPPQKPTLPAQTVATPSTTTAVKATKTLHQNGNIAQSVSHSTSIPSLLQSTTTVTQNGTSLKHQKLKLAKANSKKVNDISNNLVVDDNEANAAEEPTKKRFKSNDQQSNEDLPKSIENIKAKCASFVDFTLDYETQYELLKFHRKSKNYHGTAKQFGVSHEEARAIIKSRKFEYQQLLNQ